MDTSFVIISTIWTIQYSFADMLPVVGFGNKVTNDNCPIFNTNNVTHEAVPLSVVACAYAQWEEDIPEIEECYNSLYSSPPFIGSELDNLEDFICQTDIEDVDNQVRKCAGRTDGWIRDKGEWFFDTLYALWGNFTLQTQCQMKVYVKMDDRMAKQESSPSNRKLLHKHYLDAARTYFDPAKYPDSSNSLEYFERSMWIG